MRPSAAEEAVRAAVVGIASACPMDSPAERPPLPGTDGACIPVQVRGRALGRENDEMYHNYAIYVTQVPVMNAAWAFAKTYWIDQDMRATWRLTHPTLRRCWSQAWLMPLLEQGRVGGYDPDAVAEAFAEDEVDHELWTCFVRTQVMHTASLAIDQDSWGLKANPEFVAPDVMLVRLLSIPDAGAVGLDATVTSVPLLMQYDVEPGWRLLNFGSDQIPVPGWPPHLGSA